MRERRSWHFGPFEVDTRLGELRREGRLLHLAPKPMALLIHLLRRAGETVSRRELSETVWPGMVVSDSAFQSVVRDLRRELGDSSSDPSFIATIRGRGLKLMPPVESVAHEAPPLSTGGADGPWQEAVQHLERALRALDLVRSSRGQAVETKRGKTIASRERGEILVLMAQARWAVGCADEARSAFREAAQTARRLRDPEILARAALGFAGRTDVTPGINLESVSLLEEALRELADEHSELRAELLARLGTELYLDPDPHRSDRLTAEAVSEAEAARNPAVLAYTLTARHFVLERPEIDPAERLRLADRAIGLVSDGAPSDVLAIALQERLLDLLEQGDGAGFEATLERYRLAVRDLGQPFFSWLLIAFEGCRALLRGELDDAEGAATEALALGEQIGTPNALSVFAAQLFAIRDHQGRLCELQDLLAGLVSDRPALPVFRAGRAAVVAASDDPTAAHEALREVFARDLDDFPRDRNWLVVLGLLAPAVVKCGEAAWGRRLITLLEPFAGRTIAVGYGAAVLGSVSHYLGLLHAGCGDRRASDAHFEAALREHRALGSHSWVERSRQASRHRSRR